MYSDSLTTAKHLVEQQISAEHNSCQEELIGQKKIAGIEKNTRAVIKEERECWIQ
jgi:hypothetical protein